MVEPTGELLLCFVPKLVVLLLLLGRQRAADAFKFLVHCSVLWFGDFVSSYRVNRLVVDLIVNNDDVTAVFGVSEDARTS